MMTTTTTAWSTSPGMCTIMPIILIISSYMRRPATQPPAPAASAAPDSPLPLAWASFHTVQLADQPRLPWNWQLQGKTTDGYTAVRQGKWWSSLQTANGERNLSHIGRIMETELGEQLHGEDRCLACEEGGWECWAYSRVGAQQVHKPGDTCARCRVRARPGGCSISKRAKPKPRRVLPAPPLRPLLPKGPQPPPPGARGMGLMV